MEEVAAHQPARRVAGAVAGLVVDLANLAQSTKGHRRRERCDDQITSEPRRQLDRWFRERGDVGRDRPLRRLRRDRDIVQAVMAAAMGQRLGAGPETPHDFHTFLEDGLVVVKRDAERRVFAPVIAAAGGEIDPPARQQIERRPLFRNADRVVERQHRHRRRQPDPLGTGGYLRQNQIRAGQDAQRRKMMLADPRRMQPDLLGVNRLVEDIGNQLVRGAWVVFVMVVAEREIAELHVRSPPRGVRWGKRRETHRQFITVGLG
jgi:hypothetical protein